MKIIDVNQIREADKYTIDQEPVSSVDLMERAAMACVNWVTGRFDKDTKFTIVCGLGNNGGDGLAIARLLKELDYSANVVIIRHSEKTAENFEINLQRLDKLQKSNKLNKSNRFFIYEIKSSPDISSSVFSEQPEERIIIDAILGSGLNKPVEGLIRDVINFINQQPFPVISIDVPSGLYCDELNNTNDCIVKAAFALTFQLPKLSFMFSENAKYIGEFSVLDIGLHPGFIHHVSTKNYFVAKNHVRLFLKTRSKIAHKGNFGHALLVAGSYGKMGASVLAAKACMHAGAGLLTVHIPKCGYDILQTSIPEAMIDADTEAHFISDSIRIEQYNSIGVGPGIGTEKQTQNVVKLLIQNAKVPLVIDADAINSIAENKTWLAFIPADSIFTPHPKEFERLAGKAENSAERLKIQREFSIKNLVYVVLKGAHTSISCPNGDVYFNSTGNPGMATGGSGDVLTGVITSLMAQGYTSHQSCILGVYLHGLAGDFAAHEKSEESMIASDIIDHLSDAFKFIRE